MTQQSISSKSISNINGSIEYADETPGIAPKKLIILNFFLNNMFTRIN
jgi:hypothetical protein